MENILNAKTIFNFPNIEKQPVDICIHTDKIFAISDCFKEYISFDDIVKELYKSGYKYQYEVHDGEQHSTQLIYLKEKLNLDNFIQYEVIDYIEGYSLFKYMYINPNDILYIYIHPLDDTEIIKSKTGTYMFLKKYER